MLALARLSDAGLQNALIQPSTI